MKLEFPRARFQFCVLHAVRGSLRKERNKDREGVAESLKGIFRGGFSLQGGIFGIVGDEREIQE